MSTTTPIYLIKLGLASVQRFIGAARRSRDLLSGSWLVAEVVKAAARYLHERPTVALIFPASDNPEKDLAPGSDFQPSNVVLAQVQTKDPAAIVNGALDAARDRWRELNELALADLQERLRRSRVAVDEAVWRAQAEDALELFGVWLPWSNPAANPPLADLEALYSARKRTRTFRAHPVKAQRDKSSLDARGESVIRDGNTLTPRLRYRLALNSTEHLDATGWTKRLGTGLGDTRRRFTPLIRVALDPWLRTLAGNAELAPWLSGLREDCRKLARYGVVTRVDAGCYRSFRYDAELLLPTRWRAARRALGDLDRLNQGQKQLQKFQTHYRDLEKKIKKDFPTYCLGEPYLAIVCADGDQLGKIQQECSLEQLQALSRFLSGFALTVRTTVAKYNGDCIYAGGDELLALAPLDQLWDCLGNLRGEFVTGIAEWKSKWELLNVDSDYSIGVAIVHAFERDALPLAREALALAKNVEAKDPDDRRKALGIVYQPRSGATVRARLRWESKPTEGLQAWQEAFHAKQLPKRTSYVLRQLLATHSWVLKDYRTAKALLPGEIRRVLTRRQPAEPGAGTGPAPLERLTTEISDLIESFSYGSDSEGMLKHWVNALLIARSVAEKYP